MPFGISLSSPGPAPPAPDLPPELTSLVPLPGRTDPVGPATKPPPPTDAQRSAELEVSRAFEKARTPEGDRWAEFMANFGGTTLWKDEAAAARAELGKRDGARMTAGVASAMGAALIGTFVVGPKYERDRPYELDPTLTTVGGLPGTSSYPSGHAVQAYAAASVIAAAAPWRADRVFDLAEQNALSRVYAGVHLPSDVAAGARLGRSIGSDIVDKLNVRPAERREQRAPEPAAVTAAA